MKREAITLMLCQKCGLMEATIHREETIYRQKIEEHLCPLCAGIGIWSPPSPEKRPKAEHATGASEAIAGYLSRLYAMDSRFSYLSVKVAADRGILVVRKHPSAGSLDLVIQCGKATGFEASVRGFLLRQAVAIDDSLSFKEHLHCKLPDSHDQAAQLLNALLTSCFSVQKDDLLEIAFG